MGGASRAPLAVPAFVNSYSWVTAIPSLGGLLGGVLISTLSYFPLVYIPTAATLRRLDPAVEESARALGADPSAVFFRVVLPQLRLAIAGGACWSSLHLLAEYGAFVFIRFDTFTTAIFEQYQSTFNGTAATMLAGVLVLLCLTLLVIESSVRGSARYARIGSGAPRPPPPNSAGGTRLPPFCSSPCWSRCPSVFPLSLSCGGSPSAAPRCGNSTPWRPRWSRLSCSASPVRS